VSHKRYTIQKCTPILTITTRDVWRMKIKLRALPSKTHTLLLISMLHVWFIDVNRPSATLKVTVMLNKCRYSREIDRDQLLFGNSFIRRLCAVFLCLQTHYQTAIFLRYSTLNHVQWLKPLKQKTLRINTIWRNSVVTKHCCEQVSKYGISTKLFWVNFKLLHIGKCSVDISSSVLLGRVVTE